MNKLYVKNLNAWSEQFTKDEWNKICKEQQFLDTVMDDIEQAAGIATTVLGRKIEPFTLKLKP